MAGAKELYRVKGRGIVMGTSTLMLPGAGNYTFDQIRTTAYSRKQHIAEGEAREGCRFMLE